MAGDVGTALCGNQLKASSLWVSPHFFAVLPMHALPTGPPAHEQLSELLPPTLYSFLASSWKKSWASAEMRPSSSSRHRAILAMWPFTCARAGGDESRTQHRLRRVAARSLQEHHSCWASSGEGNPTRHGGQRNPPPAWCILQAPPKLPTPRRAKHAPSSCRSR